MTVSIEEFVAHIGWEVDPGKLSEFNDQVDGLVSGVKKVAAAIVGATAALTAFAVVTNKQTSINARLAESIDLSAESLENWTFLLGAVDMNAGSVIKTVKTLNDRIGQAAAGIGDAATVKDSIKAIGLEFDDLKRKDPEGQFRAILQGAKDLEDGQMAAAVATQLLGRQGAFLVGFIRDQEGSIEDLMTEQAKFNLLTEENRESAKNFIGLWDNFGAVIDSSKARFAAFLGDALSPLFEEYLEWVKLNRELIKVKLAEWAERAGKFLTIVFRTIQRGIIWIDRLIDALGGMEQAMVLLAGAASIGALNKIFKVFRVLGPLIATATGKLKLFSAAMAGAKVMTAVGLWLLLALSVNSLIRFFQGKDSLVGDIGDKIAEQAHIGVAALAEFLGFSKEEFDTWLVGFVEKSKDFAAEYWFIVLGPLAALIGLLIKTDWSELFDNGVAAFSTFAKAIRGVLGSLVNWIAGFIPNKILAVFRDTLNKVLGMVRKIPFVGDAVDFVGSIGQDERLEPGRNASGIGFSTGLLNARRFGSQQGPSPGVVSAVTSTRNIQNAVSNTRQGSVNTFNIDMPVTQQPGEDGIAFANRVRGVLETEVSTAIRDNDKGVV